MKKLLIGLFTLLFLSQSAFAILDCGGSPFALPLSAYNGTSDYSAQDTAGVGGVISSDGLHYYLLGDGNNLIYQYDLSVAGDITSKSFIGSKSISAQSGNPRDIAISSDGTKIYMLEGGGLNRYIMSTPYDITTASYSNIGFMVGQSTSMSSVAISEDGLKVLASNGASIFQYRMSSAHSNSLTFEKSKSMASYGSVKQMQYIDDGNSLLVAITSNTSFYQFSLPVQKDVATLNINYIFSLITTSSNIDGLSLSPDDRKLYIVNNITDNIDEYNIPAGGLADCYVELDIDGVVTNYTGDLITINGTTETSSDVWEAPILNLYYNFDGATYQSEFLDHQYTDIYLNNDPFSIVTDTNQASFFLDLGDLEICPSVTTQYTITGLDYTGTIVMSTGSVFEPFQQEVNKMFFANIPRYFYIGSVILFITFIYKLATRRK